MNATISFNHAVERLLKHDRELLLSAVILLTGLSWAYLYELTLHMNAGQAESGMISMTEMMRFIPWSAKDALFMFVMWAVMMVGMMLPSATPMILLHARVVRHQGQQHQALTHSVAFLCGYLVVWTGFSAFATLFQWGIEQAALLSPMMVSSSPSFTAILLIIAAVYQWTPYKNACLKRCRSPVWFLSSCWRDGRDGAFHMGLAHGVYCLGCCWSLMLLLFAGGVMNLLCVAAITVFVLIEKVSLLGRAIGRAGAVMLGLFGIIMLIGN